MQLVDDSSRPSRRGGGLWCALATKVLRKLGDPALTFELWNGERIAPSNAATSVLTLRFTDSGALLRLMLDPELQFGELFTANRIQCLEGDLVAGLSAVFRKVPIVARAHGMAPTLARLQRGLRRNSLRGSRRNIHRHYDLGNDFYRLWLDPGLSYTCAYFREPQMTLAEAQTAKLDHVCRKLQLRAGESVVEAGCGWGSLAIHMARNYGVNVSAYNISAEQIRCARERATQAGVADRVQFIHDDYRQIRGTYDAFVSVGMLEHVGIANYPVLGRLIARTLRANGRGLVHSIGRAVPAPINRWIERNIFPGACIPSPGEMCAVFESGGLAVLDMENLRLHYAKTLRYWLQAFESQRALVAQMFDESFVRMWQLYLASSQAAFLSGEMQLYQVVFAPARSNTVAMTRAHLYSDYSA